MSWAFGGDPKQHPFRSMLALYSSGDLAFTKRLWVRQHLFRCSQCRGAVQGFVQGRTALLAEAENGTLAPFENRIDWMRLQREMLGNIAVGVAAARCIENVGRKRRTRFVGVWVAAGLSTLFVLGWFTHIPAEQNTHLVRAFTEWLHFSHHPKTEAMLEATAEGISVKTQGVTLVLRSPRSAAVSVLEGSAVTSRYVDENTGQVTIANVYGQ